MKKLFAIFMLIFVVSCTSQQRAKRFGGSTRIDLPAGKELVTATWKGDDLWLLYKDRAENRNPATHIFKESSSWGMLEGKITIIEK
jgi:hypothetical protein